MKKIILSSLLIGSLLASSLSAKMIKTENYNLYTSVFNDNIDLKNITIKEIYFGEKDKFDNSILSKSGAEAVNGIFAQSGAIINGSLEGMGKGGLIGAGVGLTLGLAGTVYKFNTKATHFFYVCELTDNKGVVSKASVLLSTKNETLIENKEMMKEIILRGIENESK